MAMLMKQVKRHAKQTERWVKTAGDISALVGGSVRQLVLWVWKGGEVPFTLPDLGCDEDCQEHDEAD
jgi:hypothetical protein